MHSRRVIPGIAGDREAEVRSTAARSPRAMAGVAEHAPAEQNCRQNKKNARGARAAAVPAGVEGAGGEACGGACAYVRWRWSCFLREARALSLCPGPPPLACSGGGRRHGSRKDKNDHTMAAGAVPAEVGVVAVREGAQAGGRVALAEETPRENIAGNVGGVAGVAVEGGADGGAAAAW